MIGVTVMLVVPGGIQKLYLLEIQNDGTGTPEYGNYDVRLFKGDGERVAGGRVHAQNRANDALLLVYKAIQAIGGDYERAVKPRGE